LSKCTNTFSVIFLSLACGVPFSIPYIRRELPKVIHRNRTAVKTEKRKQRKARQRFNRNQITRNENEEKLVESPII